MNEVLTLGKKHTGMRNRPSIRAKFAEPIVLKDLLPIHCMVCPNMQRYYHMVSSDEVETALENGIEPARGGISISKLGLLFGTENYIMLWKNPEIFEGILYNQFSSEGYKFLSVDLPSEHPVERDYSGKDFIKRDIEFLKRVLVRLAVPIDFGKIIGSDTEFFKSISRLSKNDKIMAVFDKGVRKIAQDDDALIDIFTRAPDEKWDDTIGFYRTRQAISPHAPYSIKPYKRGML